MRDLASIIALAAACIAALVHTAATVNSNSSDKPAVLPIMGWQSYCAFPRHSSQESDHSPTVNRVELEGKRSHSMFAFLDRQGPRLRDLNSGHQWEMDGRGRFTEADPASCPRFAAAGFEFSDQDDMVTACNYNGCRSISVQPGTWVYAYAATRDAAVAVTNYGDALLFRDGEWCRMGRTGETYRCSPDAEMLTKPRGVQFYSSIRYKGVTLMGEWPSGRLYIFDGKEIRLWRNQPPHVGSDPIGYEAQSMAEYCGDLYVGYWPTGSIWRLHRGQWSEIKLFPDNADFIPHSSRPADDLDSSFFGRRVTALVPWQGALYATTSNLRGWGAGQETVIRDKEAELYGAIWRIGGCPFQQPTVSQDASSIR